MGCFFFFKSRRRHTRCSRDWSSDVCSSDLTGGGADFAFDTYGSIETTQQAVDCLGKSGVAVIAGLAPVGDRAGIDLTDLVRRQKRVIGAYYGGASPHESFRTVVDLYLRGDLLCDELVQRRYPLEQINEGFAALERGENGRGVIVFYPSPP